MNKELEEKFDELIIGMPKLENHYENNANLSEALNYLYSFINEMTSCLENPKQYVKNYNKEIFYKYKHTLETTVKQALLKAQEQEKLLESGDLSDGSHTFNQLYSQICQMASAFVETAKEANEYKEVIDIIRNKRVNIEYLRLSSNAREYNSKITIVIDGVKYSKSDARKLTQKEFELVKRYMR